VLRPARHDFAGGAEYCRRVRLAAIDLGTNSVHMVIADVTPDGRIVVVDRVKEMVRLGRKAFTTGRLAPETMKLAAKALRTFGRLARARKVQRLRTVATSAVREARNGAAFVARLRRETGMPIRVISGPEEARLIFQAARHAVGLEGGPHLLVDVGGGSVELSLAYDGKPLWLESLPLGVARLTDGFLTKDPPSAGQVQRLERHLVKEMGDLLERAKRAGAVQAVGTSGTINTLVAMALAARGEESARLHGAHATADEISRIRRRVLQLSTADRTELPGMDQKRVDLMPAAVVLVDTILSRAGGPDLVACSWALREGVLLDLAGVTGSTRTGAASVRRRSVEALAHRWVGNDVHGRHVARLALQLFDALAGDLGLPIASREMLEYAALLHDVGRAVEHDRHQRHTYYIVKNSELLGFSPVEIEMLAQVARGHRKQPPRVSDPDVEVLSPARRRAVRGLAALLRVADALDRTRQGVVSSLDVSRTDGRLVIRVDAGAERAELELWAAERRTDLLGRLLDRPVLLRAQRASRARPAARAS
jgi:exopolyphosphatase/guanosine-5'-triphosphate,3'-diphosphate pyrophosphatase